MVQLLGGESVSEGVECDECGAVDETPTITKGIWVCPICDIVFEIKSKNGEGEDEDDYDA